MKKIYLKIDIFSKYIKKYILSRKITNDFM